MVKHVCGPHMTTTWIETLRMNGMDKIFASLRQNTTGRIDELWKGPVRSRKHGASEVQALDDCKTERLMPTNGKNEASGAIE